MDLHPNLASNLYVSNQRAKATPSVSFYNQAPFTQQAIPPDPRLINDRRCPQPLSSTPSFQSNPAPSHRLSQYNNLQSAQQFNSISVASSRAYPPDPFNPPVMTTRSATALQNYPPICNTGTYTQTFPNQHPNLAYYNTGPYPTQPLPPSNYSQYNLNDLGAYPSSVVEISDLKKNNSQKSPPKSFAHRLQQKVRLSSKLSSKETIKPQASSPKEKNQEFKLTLKFQDPDAVFSNKKSSTKAPAPELRPPKPKSIKEKEKPTEPESLSFADEIFLELQKPKEPPPQPKRFNTSKQLSNHLTSCQSITQTQFVPPSHFQNQYSYIPVPYQHAQYQQPHRALSGQLNGPQHFTRSAPNMVPVQNRSYPSGVGIQVHRDPATMDLHTIRSRFNSSESSETIVNPEELAYDLKTPIKYFNNNGVSHQAPRFEQYPYSSQRRF
ncbi:hypothetical protein BB560_000336 [Smittium megazygosporum]|uniref:Uncharacterized protein n=1 Tax=Smittium megazygosporum TaxID=133381 RepID=A0A2T9ZKM7_9FUNG|nr:hypothetical protein BB560_000336 [Smittium megazygosporum]